MFTLIALFGSIVGSWLIAKQNRNGFYLWIIANTFWLINSIGRGDITQGTLWVYNDITCVIGLLTWRK